MIIFPAIDIKDGQCVRLYQGDFAQVTIYDADPVMVAQRWQAAGASWLHVVDLDGIRGRDGHPDLEEFAVVGRRHYRGEVHRVGDRG